MMRYIYTIDIKTSLALPLIHISMCVITHIYSTYTKTSSSHSLLTRAIMPTYSIMYPRYGADTHTLVYI